MAMSTITVKPGQWWNAPPEQQFRAYYLNLRVNYGWPALEAFRYAKENAAALGIGRPGGFIGLMRDAIRGPRP